MREPQRSEGSGERSSPFGRAVRRYARRAQIPSEAEATDPQAADTDSHRGP